MHFTGSISIPSALLISIFSILFVFVLLYVISQVITLISVICNKFGQKTETKSLGSKNSKNGDSDEIVAVITAAISAYNDGRDVNIKSIRESGTGLWIKNSRIESQK